MGPSANDGIDRIVQLQLQKLCTCPASLARELQRAEAGICDPSHNQLRDYLRAKKPTSHYELQHKADQAAATNASSREQLILQQQASTAWARNLLAGARKQAGMQQLLKDDMAGDMDDYLPHLLRYAAHWLYLHILQHAWCPDQGPYQSALACTEPLFQLLPPHQQLQLVGEVLGALCQKEAPLPDTLLHTAALLSLVRLAGQLAQVEATPASPSLLQPLPKNLHTLVSALRQPSNQGMAVAGRLVGKSLARSGLPKEMVLLPSVMPSAVSLASAAADMMQQLAAAQVAMASVFGPQPSRGTQEAWGLLQEALVATSSTLGYGCVPAQGPAGTGTAAAAAAAAAAVAAAPSGAGVSTSTSATAAAAAAPSGGDLVGMQHVLRLVEALSAWQAVKPGQTTTSSSSSSTAQPPGAKASSGQPSSSADTVNKLLGTLLPWLRQAMRAWEVAVAAAAVGDTAQAATGQSSSPAAGTPQQAAAAAEPGAPPAEPGHTQLAGSNSSSSGEGSVAITAHPLVVVLRMLLAAVVARTQLQGNKLFVPEDEVRPAGQHLLLAARAPLAAAQEVVEAAKQLLTTRLAASQLDHQQQQQQQQQQPAQQAAAARRQLLLQLRCAEAALSSAQARLGDAFGSFLTQVAGVERSFTKGRLANLVNTMASRNPATMFAIGHGGLGLGYWTKEQVGVVVGSKTLYPQRQQFTLEGLCQSFGCQAPPSQTPDELMQALLNPAAAQVQVPGWPVHLGGGAALAQQQQQQQQQQQPWSPTEVQAFLDLHQLAAANVHSPDPETQEVQQLLIEAQNQLLQQVELIRLLQAVPAAQGQVQQPSPAPGGFVQLVPPGGAVSLPLSGVSGAALLGNGPPRQQQQQQRSPGMQRGFLDVAPGLPGASTAAAGTQQQQQQQQAPPTAGRRYSSNGGAPLLAPLAPFASVLAGGSSAASPSPTLSNTSSSGVLQFPPHSTGGVAGSSIYNAAGAGISSSGSSSSMALPPGLQRQARRPPPGCEQGPSPTQTPTAAGQVQPRQQQQHQQQEQLQQLRGLMPLQLGVLGSGGHSAFQPVASSSQASPLGTQDEPLCDLMQMRGGAPSEVTLSSHGSSRAGSWCGSGPGSPHLSSSSSNAEGQHQHRQQGEQEGSQGLCLRLRGGVPSDACSTASSSQAPPEQAAAMASSSSGSLPQQPWQVADACLLAWAADAASSRLGWPAGIKQQAQQVWQQVAGGAVAQALAAAAQVPPQAQGQDEQAHLAGVLNQLLDEEAPSLLCQPLLSPEQWQALVAWWKATDPGERLDLLKQVGREQALGEAAQEAYSYQALNSFCLIQLLWSCMVNGDAPQLAGLPAGQRQLLLPTRGPAPAADMPGATRAMRGFLTELARQLTVVCQTKYLLAVALDSVLPAAAQQATAGGHAGALPIPWPEELREWVAPVVLCAALLQNCIMLLVDALLQQQHRYGRPSSTLPSPQEGRAYVLAWCAHHCPPITQFRVHQAGWLAPWQEVMEQYISTVMELAVPWGPAGPCLGQPLWLPGALQLVAMDWLREGALGDEVAACMDEEEDRWALRTRYAAQQQVELLVAVGLQQEALEQPVTISGLVRFMELWEDAKQQLAGLTEAELQAWEDEYEEDWSDEWEDEGTEVAASEHEEWQQQLDALQQQPQQGRQQSADSRLLAELALADAMPSAEALPRTEGARSTTPGGRRRLVAPRGHGGAATTLQQLQQTIHQLQESVATQKQEGERLRDIDRQFRQQIAQNAPLASTLAQLLRPPSPSDHQRSVHDDALGVLMQGIQALTGIQTQTPQLGTSSTSGLGLSATPGTALGSSSSSSSSRLPARAPAVTCGPEHQDWQQLVNWVQRYGFDSQAAPVAGEGLHTQVGPVLRVYASEVGHLGRLLEPLAQRAARRLGQLLEAKQRAMYWLKLGPAPTADGALPMTVLLPDGRKLPSQDWSPQLAQQYDYLRRLAAALQQRSQEVEAVVVAMAKYQPKPGDFDKGEKKVSLDKAVSAKAVSKEELEAFLAWGTGLRSLYWGLRAAAAPRFWGELRARQRRLKGKLAALRQLQAAWAALAPGSAQPPAEQQQGCSQALAAGEALGHLQQQLLEGLQGLLRDAGSQLPHLLMRGCQWQTDILFKTKIEADILRNALRRTANEARMQQVLYVARHRGLVLPRGTTGHQLAAACRLITDKALLKVPELFTSSLHPWRWLACRPHAAAHMAPLGTFARGPSYESYSQPSGRVSSEGRKQYYAERRPMSPQSSNHSAGSGASRGGTRHVFRRHTGRHFPQDGWGSGSFTGTSRGESLGDADGSSDASSGPWGPTMQGNILSPADQRERRDQRRTMQNLVLQQQAQVQGEALGMYQRARQVLLAAGGGDTTAAAAAAAAAAGSLPRVEGGSELGVAGGRAAGQGGRPPTASHWLDLGCACGPKGSQTQLLEGSPPHAWVRPGVESSAGVTLVTPQRVPAWDKEAVLQSLENPRRGAHLKQQQQEVPEEVFAVVEAVRPLATYMPFLLADTSQPQSLRVLAPLMGSVLASGRRESVMQSMEQGSPFRELLWDTLIEQKPESEVLYMQWAIQLMADRLGDTPLVQQYKGVFDKWRAAAAAAAAASGDRSPAVPGKLHRVVLACPHLPLWECMAGSVLSDLLLVPAAWRDLLGPGVGGGGRLSSNALRLPPQAKAAAAPNTAADSSRSHGEACGAAAATPPDAQQASLLLVQVARAARSSYSATYSPRSLLLSLLKVLVLAPSDELLQDLMQLSEEGGPGTFTAAAVAAQAAADWGLVDGHDALLHTAWQRAASSRERSTTTSDNSNQGRQGTTPLTTPAASSSSSSEGKFAGLVCKLDLLLLHSSPIRGAVGHKAWLRLLALWGHALKAHLQGVDEKEKEEARLEDAMAELHLQYLHRLLPQVVVQLQEADVAELLQLLLGVGTSSVGQQSSRGGSGTGVGAAAAAVEATAGGAGPAEWWQQCGAWQWRPQPAEESQEYRQQQVQQAPSSSGLPPAVASCWEACDWCQGQVPCSGGNSSSHGSSSDDGRGAQDQRQQKQGSNRASGAASGAWGCPHCGMARYCSAGCAAAAKQLHSTNCWRLAAMARPDPSMSAWRLPSTLNTPLFTFLQQPGSQQSPAVVA